MAFPATACRSITASGVAPNSGPPRLNAFESEVRKHPEVRECYLVTGEEDYLLRLETEGAGDYERVHKEILSRLPGVSRINSSFAIRSVI